MSTRACALALSVLLAGCTPQQPLVWYKPGTAPSEFGPARFKCLQQSTATAPVRDVVTGIGQTAVDKGTIYHEDVNQAARENLFAACMQAAGWRLMRDADARAQYAAEQAASHAPPSPAPAPEITPAAAATPPASGAVVTGTRALPLERQGGIYVLPVLINNVITLKFVLDSGASEVSIPADVAGTLVRAGTVRKEDFLGKQTYVMADGSEVPSQRFRIRSLKVGDLELRDVTAGIAPPKGELLLGQSFLSRLSSWSIDNAKHALVIN